MSENILHVENVTMQFGGVVAVNNLSMDIYEHEIVALIGPNGAGKTTAFNCITGVYEPTNGKVEFYGEPIVESFPRGKMKKLYAGENADRYHQHIVSTPDAITKRGIARTFQNIRLFRNLTVLDNVLIALNEEMKYSAATAILRLPEYWRRERIAKERALELLSIFDMQDMADHKAGSLPYGAQRRLEIVRALATNPCLLLLDEPAAGMNEEESVQLSAFIRNIRDSRDLTIVIIDHHMDVIMSICDRVSVLNFGTLLADGEPSEIQSNPEVIAAYLGVDE